MENEFEFYKKIIDQDNKIKKNDFVLIINQGSVIPLAHQKYNEGRIMVEIYKNNIEINTNINFEGKKIEISSSTCEKLEGYLRENLNEIINYSLKQSPSFMSQHLLFGGAKNLLFKLGSIIINLSGNVDNSQMDIFCSKIIDGVCNIIKESM
jgi:hypothetical protein